MVVIIVISYKFIVRRAQVFLMLILAISRFGYLRIYTYNIMQCFTNLKCTEYFSFTFYFLMKIIVYSAYREATGALLKTINVVCG